MLIALSMGACSLADGSGDTPENAVYMGNPNTAGVVAVIASDESGASYSVTPRLASIATKSVDITLAVDEAALEAYNKANNLSLKPVSADDIIFVGEDGKEAKKSIIARINPGSVLANVVVKINSLDSEKYPYKDKYAIPVKIVDVSNGYKLLSDPTTTIITLNRKIKTSVMKVDRFQDTGIVFRPKETIKEEMTEWTFQMSVIYSNLSRSNLTTAYINDAGSGEFYTRISGTAGIQVKNGRDGDDTWTQTPLNINEWLNISYVYRRNGNAGSLKVYVNGKFLKEFTTTALFLSNKDTSGWTVGNTNWGNDYLREVRFWDRALTDAEILDKLYMPQDPASPGLLMYVPFNKESYNSETSTFTDLTGKWTVTMTSGSSVSFIDYVVFPSETLVVEAPVTE